jgi:hypothetical protein
VEFYPCEYAEAARRHPVACGEEDKETHPYTPTRSRKKKLSISRKEYIEFKAFCQFLGVPKYLDPILKSWSFFGFRARFYFHVSALRRGCVYNSCIELIVPIVCSNIVAFSKRKHFLCNKLAKCGREHIL